MPQGCLRRTLWGCQRVHASGNDLFPYLQVEEVRPSTSVVRDAPIHARAQHQGWELRKYWSSRVTSKVETPACGRKLLKTTLTVIARFATNANSLT